MTSPNNVIVTGIPRAGTTLAAALIDTASNAVCLNEPLWQVEWAIKSPHSSANDFITWLEQDYGTIRNRLLKGEEVLDRRAPDGSATTNYFYKDPVTGKVETTYKILPYTKAGLNADFTLAVKHNSLFLSALPQLAESAAFTTIAILRNPWEVIASWQNLDLPISQGKLPHANFYWPEMKELTNTPMERLTKLAKIYDLICKRIATNASKIHVVKYEELIENHTLLHDLLGLEKTVAAAQKVNKKVFQDMTFKNTLRNIFEAECSEYRKFYTFD